MNICFYTSEEPSVTSRLNMQYLAEQRPDHNYTFLRVRTKPQPKPSLVDLAKRKYAAWKFDDGRFDFGRDLAALDKRLAKHIPKIKVDDMRTGYADAVNDEASVQFLKEAKPDLIIQAGAGILKQNIFELAPTINLHHGMAPEIRGIESTFWCIYYGIREQIGVTCHFIDATLDTGAIVKQRALNSASITFADNQYENIMAGRELLVESVDILNKGNYKIVSMGEVASYYFGLPGSAPYVELKKRNFAPVKDISEKAFKMKEKRVVQ